jgi:hypothetical protein
VEQPGFPQRLVTGQRWDSELRGIAQTKKPHCWMRLVKPMYLTSLSKDCLWQLLERLPHPALEYCPLRFLPESFESEEKWDLVNPASESDSLRYEYGERLERYNPSLGGHGPMGAATNREPGWGVVQMPAAPRSGFRLNAQCAIQRSHNNPGLLRRRLSPRRGRTSQKYCSHYCVPRSLSSLRIIRRVGGVCQADLPLTNSMRLCYTMNTCYESKRYCRRDFLPQ